MMTDKKKFPWEEDREEGRDEWKGKRNKQKLMDNEPELKLRSLLRTTQKMSFDFLSSKKLSVLRKVNQIIYFL